jgi:ABC-type multidrug transport system fused ATPase/permease subunit
MLASYQYPLLDLFWTMFMIFAFIIWIWLLIYIFMDIFRSHDIGGFAKAMWIIFIIILPILGILVYLIARGHGMQERNIKQAQQQQQAFDDYVRQTAAESDPADQIAKLSALKDKGTITQAEFDAQKAKLLG